MKATRYATIREKIKAFIVAPVLKSNMFSNEKIKLAVFPPLTALASVSLL